MSNTLRNRFAVASGVVAVTVLSSTVAASPVNAIVGGERDNTEWVVDLTTYRDTGAYGCTGSLIEDDLVLTARHCVEGGLAVDLSGSTVSGGVNKAEAWQIAPAGDIAIVKLSQEEMRTEYGTVNVDFVAENGGAGTIHGFGMRSVSPDIGSDGRYQASVRLLDGYPDAYGGSGQRVQGVSGAPLYGDSGGPLVVDGNVVAVGSNATINNNVDHDATYGLLSQQREWVNKVLADN